MDKWERYWISPKGEVVKLALGQQHSAYAKEYYEIKGVNITPGDATQKLLDGGWLRIQAGEDYVAIEGKESEISEHGSLAVNFKPDFKKLVFSFTDTGRFKQIYRDKAEGWSWDAIVKEAKKGMILDGAKNS
ncbi:MAG: hypothetical protein HZC16_01670 [Candidatus Omnitrophica bacterium]|nr:hypothetical protein [Candidatus Omnitrophota bacterium]